MTHDWIPSTLGHGELMCSRCFVTNREASVLKIMQCEKAPKPEEPELILRAFRKTLADLIPLLGNGLSYNDWLDHAVEECKKAINTAIKQKKK